MTKRNLWATLMFVFVMSLLLVSCAEDAADSPLVGRWEMIKSNGSPVAQENVEYFTFYSTGSGSREYMDGNVMRSDSFEWSSFSGDYVEINYYDGTFMSYYYRFNGNNLELSENSNFGHFNTFARR